MGAQLDETTEWMHRSEETTLPGQVAKAAQTLTNVAIVRLLASQVAGPASCKEKKQAFSGPLVARRSPLCLAIASSRIS